MAQFPSFPQMDNNQQPGVYQQTPSTFPSFPQSFPQYPQPTPPFTGFPPTPPFQQPGVVPFTEQSFIENILRLNRGKVATIYMNFENSQWGSKIFKGVIEAAGKDHIIISDPATGMRYVLLSIYLNYITFDEEINYEYPYAIPATPTIGTSAPIFNTPTPNIPLTPTQTVPQFAQPSSPFTQIRKKDNTVK
ncbi:MAG: gerQ [Haloplasmataceae bacterium]|jgi:spore germination protein Q|nr:gerQ [Haloplasmataceae bacterium]